MQGPVYDLVFPDSTKKIGKTADRVLSYRPNGRLRKQNEKSIKG